MFCQQQLLAGLTKVVNSVAFFPADAICARYQVKQSMRVVAVCSDCELISGARSHAHACDISMHGWSGHIKKRLPNFTWLIVVCLTTLTTMVIVKFISFRKYVCT